MKPTYQEIVAVLLALTLMLFIVCSAAITIMGVGMDDKAMSFWSNFLMTITGGLIGFVAGNSKEGPK